MKPRERLKQSGSEALSTKELVAILLRTGANGMDVLKLSERVLEKFPTLSSLFSASVDELTSINGIGLAKATALKAALELGKRLYLEISEKRSKFDKPEFVYNFSKDLIFKQEEVLRVIAVNNDLRYISHRDFSGSTSTFIVVTIKDIFSFLIKISADGFFLVHNHRSNPNPSKNDIELTLKIKNAGDILNIKLVDHIIIHPKGYTSLKTEGLI
ncbi:MAG: DNA repair protein RadC [Thermotogaceae bacterium]|nr:DNA repair protein RadC [Thermotogaceae bacterium]